jgi:transcriptional regulator with XRE-family HTH domain
MSERSKLINKLKTSRDSRESYVRAKLRVLLPSQLRALRLRNCMSQPALAAASGMKQSRISAMEQPGKTNFNLETVVRMAATFKVGLVVKFVPFSEMLKWENEFSQDEFNPVTIEEDIEFQVPNIPRHVAEQFRLVAGIEPPTIEEAVSIAIAYPAGGMVIQQSTPHSRGQVSQPIIQ